MSDQIQPGWYWAKKKDSPLLKWQPAEYCSEYGWMPREPEIIGPRIPTPDEPWQTVPVSMDRGMMSAAIPNDECRFPNFREQESETEILWRRALGAAPKP